MTKPRMGNGRSQERAEANVAREDARDASEERLRLLVESVTDYAIFMLDAEGKIVSWNAGAERIKGYTASDIIGQHFSVFYTHEARLRGHPAEELRRAKHEGRYEEEGWRVRKDATRFWANVVLTAIYDRNGQHVGFSKVTRDLTERRAAELQLRESEERFRLLVASVRDYAIFMLDPSGVVTSWNAGAEWIKGYSTDEIIGRHFSLFYSEADRSRHHPDAELAAAVANGTYAEEGWRVRKDGDRFWANVVITAIYDDAKKLRGFAKVTRDLTERRRIEQAARNAENKAIEERALEARSAVRQRDDFIAVAAHELRTPISALQLKVQGVARALKRSGTLADDGRSKLVERLDGAGKQVERLTELVERLLDVSRIVAGRLVMKVEATDLTALVGQVVEGFRRLARSAGSELEFHPGESILGDYIVEAHGGTIRVSSNAGQGSTFEIDLPRSVALGSSSGMVQAEADP